MAVCALWVISGYFPPKLVFCMFISHTNKSRHYFCDKKQVIRCFLKKAEVYTLLLKPFDPWILVATCLKLYKSLGIMPVVTDVQEGDLRPQEQRGVSGSPRRAASGTLVPSREQPLCHHADSLPLFHTSAQLVKRQGGRVPVSLTNLPTWLMQTVSQNLH